MEWLPQWLALNLGFLAIFLVLVRLFARANRRKVERLAEQLTPEASMRGWQVTTEFRRDHTRVIRWTGREFDLQWVGEDLYRKRGQGRPGNIMAITRWQTVGRRGPADAIFLMGVPEGTHLPNAAAAEGLLQSLAVKAAFFALDKAIDMYFGQDIGKQIDAASLKRVDAVEPLLNGYAVFAESPPEAASIIRNGVAKAVTDTVTRGPETLRGNQRPWILLWKHGVAVARVGSTTTAAELEPFVRAGVAITKAASRF